MLQKIARTSRDNTIAIIRLMVGAVFLSEGIQKFIYPALRGAGRFESIGLPMPELLGYVVGGFEIVCGVLVLLGLLSRLASIPLITIMSVAIITTKIPICQQQGFWQMAHAARTDYAMFLGSLFLLLKGSGSWSLDGYFFPDRRTFTMKRR